MLQVIKKQFQVLKSNLLFMGIVTAVGFGLGAGLLALVVRLDGEAKNYFPVGTMLAFLTLAMYVFIAALAGISTYFHAEVGFGCTRRQFLGSHFLCWIVFCLLGAVILPGLCAAETRAYGVLYRFLEPDEVTGIVRSLLSYGFLFLAGCAVSGSLCGALLMRFGNRAQVPLLCLWLFLCIGSPRIVEMAESAPESVPGRILEAGQRALTMIPSALLPVACALLLLLLAAGTWGLLGRQQVLER